MFNFMWLAVDTGSTSRIIADDVMDTEKDSKPERTKSPPLLILNSSITVLHDQWHQEEGYSNDERMNS